MNDQASKDMADGSRKTVYLIDGTAYVYRAYHAIRSLTNSKGMPTNAVFGFTRMLIKLIEDRQPAYVGMFFDAKGPTFRHEQYAEYKANRPPMPDDLVVQLAPIKSVTEGFRIPIFEMSGWEADDLIGTLSKKAVEKGFDVVMVTGDKDFMQLVGEHAVIWDPMKDRTIDPKTIEDDFGLTPDQIIEMMGLSGDTSDNVPGVPGIGPKMAVSLIREYGDMASLYKQVEGIAKKKQKENLIAYRDQAFLSRDLVTIRTDAPVDLDVDALSYESPDAERLSALFGEYEFRQLQQTFTKSGGEQEKDYRCVLSAPELAELSEKLEAAGVFALDTETTSPDPMRAKLVGFSFSVQPHQAWYVPCGHDYLGAPKQLTLKQVTDTLGPILENPEIRKVGQNIKYDWIVLERHGFRLEGVMFDTMLASYLINPSKRSHSLDQIAMDFFGHKTTTYEEVAGKGQNAVTFNHVTLEKAVPYACEDADITLMAFRELEPRLKEGGLSELMQTVEMPLVPVLKKMEMEGVLVDKARLAGLSESFAGRLASLEEEIYALAGEHFNIKSSQQLGYILFDKLALPVQKKTKKKTGYSTDVDVLTTLADQHALPAKVLEHRTIAKLKSTYSDALVELIHPETGRIHTSFNQTVTATGRLSSSEPNLQNIPIRTEEGREIRRAFVPRPGWRLLAADYSQIELRILAHYSNDPILIESFEKNEDIHTRTAAEVFQVFPSMIDAELRRQAKVINFGIIYGMSPFGLSKALGISQKMAKTYIDSYFARYSGVKRFIDETIEAARETQLCSTLLGRIRLIPEIASSNRNVRQFAERTAVNTPIQGTAADLIKLAMIRTGEAIFEKNLKTCMILSVHDEIVFEAPEDELAVVAELVRKIMENVWTLAVPLTVNVDSGLNWAEAH